jgi:hypothetical protein
VDKYEEILKNSVEDLSQNHDASSWNCSFWNEITEIQAKKIISKPWWEKV